MLAAAGPVGVATYALAAPAAATGHVQAAGGTTSSGGSTDLMGEDSGSLAGSTPRAHVRVTVGLLGAEVEDVARALALAAAE